MIYGLGRRALRVYTALRFRISDGTLVAGARLASHTQLATEFGVAPLTIRSVLSRLQDEGLISREQGRGTFVRERVTPAVLIVDDEAPVRALLREHVALGGYAAVEASGPAEGLKALARDPSIALVLSDIRMPSTADGVGFIRTVRRRWPDLPLAAVTAYPNDLADLYGTPECPILIVTKPFRAHHIEEALRLAVRPPLSGHATILDLDHDLHPSPGGA